MLHAEEPDWICALVRGGIAVEEEAHGAVEMALAVFGSSEEWI